MMQQVLQVADLGHPEQQQVGMSGPVGFALPVHWDFLNGLNGVQWIWLDFELNDVFFI